MRSSASFWPEHLPPGWHAQAAGLMAGVDEAGRGPLAGPVVAAAVLLDARRPIEGLADSKQLSPARREKLHDAIHDRALCVSVAQASVEEIDTLNILRATLLAMRRAVEGLSLVPQRVLVDGNQLPPLDLPMDAIVRGDAQVQAISAASILAKVHRDRLCLALHARHPQYGFDRHKGYGSAAHLAALQAHGACEAHRRSFAPVRVALARAASEPSMAGDVLAETRQTAGVEVSTAKPPVVARSPASKPGGRPEATAVGPSHAPSP